jgi:hypothetical protein
VRNLSNSESLCSCTSQCSCLHEIILTTIRPAVGCGASSIETVPSVVEEIKVVEETKEKANEDKSWLKKKANVETENLVEVSSSFFEVLSNVSIIHTGDWKPLANMTIKEVCLRYLSWTL